MFFVEKKPNLQASFWANDHFNCVCVCVCVYIFLRLHVCKVF